MALNDLLIPTILAEAVDVQWAPPATGSYVDGRWVEGSRQVRTIKATIQPIPSRQLLDLPEGIRDKAQHVLWTLTGVKTNDTIHYNGRRHRVLFTWERNEGQFTRAVLGMHE